MHGGEREVLVGEKRGAEREVVELETEDSIDPEARRIFEERVAAHGIERGSDSWKALFDELVVDRLREKSADGWMREMRRRGLDVPRSAEAEPETQGAQEGEDGLEEGRRMRGPSTPYVPIDKERREHNLTHYPHRTWCEICMRGRGVAGRHSPCSDEVDNSAGEFHFDYCFLNSVSHFLTSC